MLTGYGSSVQEMRRYWTVMVLGTTLGLGIAGSCSGASAISGPDARFCRAAAPVVLTAQPARWLGDCVNGVAEGLGVMRAGSMEPYQFFVGEMRAGVPVRGMLKEADGWEMAAHFDTARAGISPRSWDPKDSHAIYILAARAAQTTAARFSSSGNRNSAAYYERLAREIYHGEPE
jgi:hypothetical protein